MTKCLENRIALYSPHTSFDAIPNGVNDWLISPFGKSILIYLMGFLKSTILCHMCYTFKFLILYFKVQI